MSRGRGFSQGRGKGCGKGRSPQVHHVADGSLNPAQLTSYIKNARTIEELFGTFSSHKHIVNHIHLSACWNSLGHLTRPADQNWFQEHAEALDALSQHTIQTLVGGKIQARQLANIAHGVARSGRGQSMGALMAALAVALRSCLGDCNAQELANAAWAFAKAVYVDAELFAALARSVEGRVSEFNAQELANVAWAFATVGHCDTKLFQSLATSIELRLSDFSAQGLANTAWAFAKVGHADAKLFASIGAAAKQRLNDFNAQDFAQAAWSFAKAGQFDATLFAALAEAAEWHLPSFSAQGLANAAWAFAKAGNSDAKLFSALATSVAERLTDFNAQDLANTAWAFAKACHLDAKFFASLARSVEQRIGDFNAQDLVNTAWAFAKIGHFDAKMFCALARAIERCVDNFDASHIANAAWAFAKVGHLDEQLFLSLAKAAEGRASDFNAQDLANTAWAFANAGQLDVQLFAALARAAEQCVGDFNDEELDNTAWAFAKAGQQSIAKRLRSRNEGDVVAVSTAPVDVSKCGRIVIAGGGIGGAAVAVALQSKGFDVVVLEADPSFDARKQGYGLTIQGSGFNIQSLGISLEGDDAPTTSHYTFSADGHILGVFGEPFRQGKDKGRRMPSASAARFIHLPRQILRERLVERIRPGTIRWNSRLESFSCWTDRDGREARRLADAAGQERNGVTVKLTDGATLEAALLVASDGIFSTVRRQLALPGDRLNYLGLIVVLGILPTEAALYPLTQRRIFETVDGSTRIYVMPFTDSVTMWQLSFPSTEQEAKRLVKDPAVLKAEICRRCAQWHAPIPALLSNTTLDSLSGYPVYDRELLYPEVLRPPEAAPSSGQPRPQRRATLIGDAAHPMSPFKAQGANQALADGVQLAEVLADCIRKHGPHLGFDVALPLFEQKMLSRSARMVVGSREKAKEMHSKLALQAARKVQRESGVDMSEIIRVLRAQGIGAHHASDPRGLDAVVAEAMETRGMNEDMLAPGLTSAKGMAERKKRKVGSVAASIRRETEQRLDLILPETQRLKQDKKSGGSSAGACPIADVAGRLWGYVDSGWHKCVLLKTTKTGKRKVEWEDGTTSTLDCDCVQPRVKKSRSSYA